MHANKRHALENHLSKQEWYFEFDGEHFNTHSTSKQSTSYDPRFLIDQNLCKMLESGLFFCFGFGAGWEKVESLDNGWTEG